eukprot:204912_1
MPIKMQLFVQFAILLSVLNPSICHELDSSSGWVVHTGSWEYDKDHTNFKNDQSAHAEMFLSNKQWYNADGRLTISFKFSADFNGNTNREFGLLLFNGVISSWCEWYYIHIANDVDGEFYVSLSRGDPPAHTETELSSVPLQFPFENRKVYHLSVVHTQADNKFEISVNNILHIAYADSNGYAILKDGHSGYIGMYSARKIELVARDLTVSGTRKSVTPLIDSDDLNCESQAPTKDTTSTTPKPNTIPTTTTTKAPSKRPTKRPTLWPTVRPTKKPSAAPSTRQPTDKPTLKPTRPPLSSSRFTYPSEITSFAFRWTNPDVSGQSSVETGPVNPDLMTDNDLATGETLTVPGDARVWGVMGSTVGMVGDFAAQSLNPPDGYSTWIMKKMAISFYDDLCLQQNPIGKAYYEDMNGNKVYIGDAVHDLSSDYITTFTAPMDSFTGDIITNGAIGFEIQSNGYCEGDIVVREFILEGIPVPQTDSPTPAPSNKPSAIPTTKTPTPPPTCPPVDTANLCSASVIECCPTDTGLCQWLQSFLCIHEGGPDCCQPVTPNPSVSPTTPAPSTTTTKTRHTRTTRLPTQSPTAECKGDYIWGDPHYILMSMEMDERKFDYQSLGWYYYLFPCDITHYNEWPFFIESHSERCFDSYDNAAGCIDKNRLILNTKPEAWIIEFGTHDGDHEKALDITVGTDVYGQTDADFVGLDFEDYKRKRPKVIKYDDGAGISGELRIFESNDGDGEWIVLQLYDLSFGECEGKVIELSNNNRATAVSCPSCLRNIACGLMGKYTRGDCKRKQMYDPLHECSNVLQGSDGVVYHAPPDRKYGNRVFETFADTWHHDAVEEVLVQQGLTVNYQRNRKNYGEGRAMGMDRAWDGRAIDLQHSDSDLFAGECHNNEAKIRSVNATCKAHTVDAYKHCCAQIGVKMCHMLWETCVEDFCACTASDWTEEQCLREVVAENMNATCSYKALFPTDAPTTAPTENPAIATIVEESDVNMALVWVVVALGLVLCVMCVIVGAFCLYKQRSSNTKFMMKQEACHVADDSDDDMDIDVAPGRHTNEVELQQEESSESEQHEHFERMKCREGDETNARALEILAEGK